MTAEVRAAEAPPYEVLRESGYAAVPCVDEQFYRMACSLEGLEVPKPRSLYVQRQRGGAPLTDVGQ